MSIIEVAKLAGVSKSTVSLVINNSPSVLPATAQKVQQAMEALGYVPSPRDERRGPKPNSMYANRSLNIALVTLGIPAAALRSPLYSDVSHSITAKVREHRHRLTVCHAARSKEFNVEEIFQSGADGFLLFGHGESGEVIQALREFPCVSLMGTERPRSGCDWVSYDDYAVGKIAATYLVEQGHRNCAYLGKPKGQRGQAFAETIHAAGGEVTVLEADGLFVARDDIHEVDLKAMDALVDRLLSLSPRPTGLFAWADMLTAALYPTLYSRGVQPGRDMTIVSCNNEWPLLFGLRPRPAVVDIQGTTIGHRAVQQLLWRMQNRREPCVTLLVAPTLITGNG